MFTQKITEADNFTTLPPTTQCLYFHLCMSADDDGFSNKIRQAMFNGHADQNDFELLVQKRFIIPFESGVIVIKHWRMHNLIRSDRYHETDYVKEKSALLLKKNGVYTDRTPNGNQMATIGIPSDNQMEPEVSIGKDIYISCSPESNDCTQNPENLDSIDSKNSKKQDSEIQLNKDFEIIYGIYPKKRGRTKAFAAYKQWVTKGKEVNGKKYKLTNRQIYMAVKKYVTQQEDAGQDDYQYWKNFDTLMGSQLLDYVTWEDPK